MAELRWIIENVAFVGNYFPNIFLTAKCLLRCKVLFHSTTTQQQIKSRWQGGQKTISNSQIYLSISSDSHSTPLFKNLV